MSYMSYLSYKAYTSLLHFRLRHKLFLLERRWRCHPLLGRFYPLSLRTKVKQSLYRRALAVFLAFLVLIPSVFIFFRPQKASADWFDDSYAYRQNFYFTHNADISTERAVTLSLDTAELIAAGLMQADCDDTRFTDINGKVLRYQLTGACNNAATTYEVVFPSIINGSNIGIVYYGNPSATSHSENVASVTALTPSGGDPSITTRTNEEKAPAPALSLKFDEGYGQTANDTSSNRNNGTLGSTANSDTSDPVWQTEDMCINGKCLKFDGTDDYVSVPDSSSVSLTGSFTLSAWINTKSNTVQQSIIEKYDTPGYNGYILRILSSGKIAAYTAGSAGNDSVTGATTITTNTWNHVVAVYNGTQIMIYLNGILDGTTSTTRNPTDGSGTLKIGARGDDAATTFKGSIDDVKIYPYARTASQIKTDAASRVPSVHGISASFGDDQSYLSNGLVGWWKMDDGVNNPCASGVDKACDSSGNNNVGTWTNGVASTSGKFGNGTNFDGVNDYVSVPASSIFDNQRITIASWVYSANFAQNGFIFEKTTNGSVDTQYSCFFDSVSSSIYFRTYNSSGTQNNLTLAWTGLVTNNAWNHIACIYDGANKYIYVNGKLATSAAYNQTLITNPAGTSFIGTFGGGGYNFNGKIDDVRIYNRALSPSEVTRLYDWAPGPVGWWKMDENTGGVVNDSSGNGNTGVNKGAYFMPLTVSNSGSTLTDYQASVSANTSVQIAAGKMQSDCDDVRFYDSDNITPLNYWLESNCNSTTTGTVFWVKIPSIPNGSKTIYMYYGNPGASAGSNGPNTFIAWHGLSNNTNFHDSNIIPPTEFIYETEYYYGDHASAVSVGLSAADNRALGDSITFRYWDEYYVKYFCTMNYPSVTDTQTYSGAMTAGQYYRVKIARFSNEARLYINGTQVGAAQTTNLPDEYMGLHTSVEIGTSYSQKYSFARKYAANEPTVTAGSETAVNLPWTPGKFGSALKLDGTDDYSISSDSNSLSVAGNLTLSSWIRLSAISSEQTIIGKWDETTGADDRSYRLWLDSSNRLNLSVSADGSTVVTHTGTITTLAANTWYHVAGIYNTVGTMDLYVNGILDAAQKASGVPASLDDNASSLYIGTKKNTGGNPDTYLNGSIDDVRVYDYVRTPKQIISDMNGGHPSVGTPIGSTVGHWSFDEGYSTTAHDKSPNANNLTLSQAAWTNSGKFGKAWSGDGVRYLSRANDNDFNFAAADDFTISIWAKRYTQSISETTSYTTYLTSTTSATWSVPTTWNNGDNTIEVIGGGGGSGSGTTYAAGGGGGGAYAKTTNLTLTLGGSVTVQVGAGGQAGTNGGNTWFNNATCADAPVCAGGGAAGTNELGGGGGAVQKGTGYSGGTGRSVYVESDEGGGGGGGAGGPGGAGNFGGSTAPANHGGGGGGGAGGGLSTPGNDSSGDTGGAGGLGPAGTAGGTAGNPGNPGSNGSGGGGANDGAGTDNENGGAGGTGTEWDATHGGGGGGGGGGDAGEGGNGGLYGGGGGGHGEDGDNALTALGMGANGLIVITYTINTEHLLNKYDAATGGYKIYLKNHKYCLGIDDDSAWEDPDDEICATDNLDDNAWHHVTAVKTGTSKIELYVDGILRASKTTLTATNTLSNTGILYIGDQDATNNNDEFKGDIDEVKIYRSALNASEVKVEYNQGKAVVWGALSTNPDGAATNSAARAYCPPGNSEGNCASASNPSPVGEWKFDERTGTSAFDTSGNGKTGTLTNNPSWTTGKTGSGLNMNGSSSYVDIGTGPTSVKTITFWVNPATTTEYFTNLTSNTDYIWANAGTITAAGITSPTIYVNGVQTSTLTAGIWQHVAVVTNTAENASNLDIGRTQDTNYLEGKIDHVRLYDYALTQAQVAWDYNRGRPVGWWKFDECLGTTAHDVSGNSNNGTITIGGTGDNSSAGNCSTVNTATAWYNGRTGKFNSALSFDGVDDYVDTVSTTAFNFERTQPFSVGAWIKSNYSGSSYILIASNMHATNLAGWEFFVDATRPGDKHLGLALLNSGPTEYLYAKDSTAFNLLDNQWHYILATYDGSSSINGIKIYIDGIYKTTTKDNGADSLTTSILSNTSLKIGQQGTSTPYWFNGAIDDVRVYNYVLTPTQIKTLYNGDSAVRFGPLTGSP